MKELSFEQEIALKNLNILNKKNIKRLLQDNLRFVIPNLFTIIYMLLSGLKLEYSVRFKYWYWKYN